MLTLRITQAKEESLRYRVDVELTGDGLTRQTGDARFEFDFDAHQREDLRWYFEDYLQYPQEPAPSIAARIERDMQTIGTRLFESVFSANNDTRRLWNNVLDQLSDTRFEIAVPVSEAAELPWELLFDPDTNEYIALQARAFVHSHSMVARTPRLPQASDASRILLVICRPAKDMLPFRSDAMCILKGLDVQARQSFQLDVLRPPTFGQLGRVLSRANREGESYHVVHFDGHGAFIDVVEEGLDANLLLSPQRPGAHGYLVFENPEIEDDVQLVDGPAIGRLLVETNVPVLLMNACRSAHAELRTSPTLTDVDPHSIVRAFGSVAQEVRDAGGPGSVAMR